MKKNLVALVAASIVLSGCVGMKVAPSARAAKKVALVSLYMNYDFVCVNPKEKKNDAPVTLGNTLKELGKEAVKIPQSLVFDLDPFDGDSARKQILRHAYDAYTAALRDTGAWDVVPVKTASVDSGDLRPVEKKKWFAPPQQWIAASGLRVIDVRKALNQGVPSVPFTTTPPSKEEVKAELTRLAAELNVDAVIVLQMFVGYEAGNMIWLDANSGRPNVGVSMVMVTKDGEMAVRTLMERRSKGPRSMLLTRPGLPVTIIDRAQKGIETFETAIDNSAAALKKDLEKRLNKI
jgi:hypothetical protein